MSFVSFVVVAHARRWSLGRQLSCSFSVSFGFVVLCCVNCVEFCVVSAGFVSLLVMQLWVVGKPE